MKKLFTIFPFVIITTLLLTACDTSEAVQEEVPCENPSISERPQSCEIMEKEPCDVMMSTIVDKSLQAYYPFDTDARDYSGNCRHGVINGGPEFVDGVSGKAIQFDGIEDLIVIPDSISPLPANLSTIVFWLKIEENIDSFDGTIMQWVYKTETTTRFRVSRVNHSSCDQCRAYTFDDNGSAVPNVFPEGWVLIVIRKDKRGNLYSLFLDPANPEDGLPIYPSTDEEGEVQGENEIILGSEISPTATPPRQFKGVIDDLRIYNRILSTAEIDELFDL